MFIETDLFCTILHSVSDTRAALSMCYEWFAHHVEWVVGGGVEIALCYSAITNSGKLTNLLFIFHSSVTNDFLLHWVSLKETVHIFFQGTTPGNLAEGCMHLMYLDNRLMHVTVLMACSLIEFQCLSWVDAHSDSLQWYDDQGVIW